MEHINWLVDTGNKLTAADGKEVTILELCHQNNDAILSSWAKHFRNHYCSDNDIDYLCRGYKFTRQEYLNHIKFPDPTKAPGPSIRSGDFAEILVADYLEYVLKYWVPRTRYSDKTIRNESTKGSDVIGFQIISNGAQSTSDMLAIFEVKAQFSGRESNPRLQDAVNDSGKDIARKAESLNAIKQRLFHLGNRVDADKIERFQNEVDYPYKGVYGAVALFETSLFEQSLISSTDSSSHPRSSDVVLVVIKGDKLMPLVHDLYRRAADEA